MTRLGPGQRGDVHEGEDDPVDHVAHGPVRQDAGHVGGRAIGELDEALSRPKVSNHVSNALGQVGVGEARHDVIDGSTYVRLDEAENLGGCRGEFLDVQFLVEVDRGDLRALEEILEVAMSAIELLDLLGELRIDGLELFVDRLHLLLGRLQFLVGGLQLLVGGE